MSTSVADLYGAEHWVEDVLREGIPVEVHGTTVTPPPLVIFGTIEGIRDFVNQEWPRWGTGNPPIVRSRASRGGKTLAHGSRYELAFNGYHDPRVNAAFSMLTVLHEMAHALAPGNKHGKKWQEQFLTLVEHYIGPEAKWLLLVGFN